MDPFDIYLWPDFKNIAADESTCLAEEFIEQVVIDSRRIACQRALFFALQGQNDGHLYVRDALEKGAKYAVVHRSWEKETSINENSLIRVDNTLDALQSFARCYHRWTNVPTIAICGSFGKTMCKDLLHQLLSAHGHVSASPESFNSQIGVPLALLQIKKGDKFALIEAGISEVGEMQRQARLIEPQAAILTHLGKKHLATLGSVPTIASEMLKLLQAVPKDGWVIIPKNTLLDELLPNVLANKIYWNETHAHYPQAFLTGTGSKLTFSINFPGSPGYQGETTSEFAYFGNLLNICLKAAWQLGLNRDAIVEGLEGYRPEVMKTEIWKSPMGATFISDTYCSDPQSIDPALRFYEQAPLNCRKVFIFGGFRGSRNNHAAHYRRVGQSLQGRGIDVLLLVGDSPYGPLVAEATAAQCKLEVAYADSKSSMLQWMADNIKAGDIVLIKGPEKLPLDGIMAVFNGGSINNRAIINFEAIRTNIALLRSKLPLGTKLMPTVKAFAYGTDEVHTAKFLAICGIDTLCVSTPDEAIALKRAGVAQSLFSINAAAFEAPKVVLWHLEVGISNLEQIKAFAAAADAAKYTLSVHLHINTGMSRFGCRPEEALMLAQEIVRHRSLNLAGIMTHFAAADDPDEDAFTLAQAAKFDAVIIELQNAGIDPPWKHAANSAAAIRFNFPQYNMVRIGLALYGLHASESVQESLELRQALSLRSRIVGINYCKKGETVSYGRSYKVEHEEERIAVIPIGYFDGLHRNYSNKGHVIIRGHKAPMVGKICMDYMMVDITHIPKADIGDSVLIFGEDEYGNYLCPQHLAMRGESIVHQLITCLGPRIQRIFTFDESK